MTGLLRFLLVATFAWAAGTDSYGSEPCSHHDALPASVTHDSHAPAGVADAHSSEATHQTGESHSDHEDGPCTCVTHCQAPNGDLPLSPVADASVHEPDMSVEEDLPTVHSVVLGPRHDLYELHLPNAPPHTT